MRKLFLLVVWAMVCSQGAFAQSTERIEVFAGFSYTHINADNNTLLFDKDRPGFNASVTGNFTRYFGLKFDVSGHYGSKETGGNIILDERPSLYNFLGGVQFKDNRNAGRFKPFAHAMIGVARAKGFQPALCIRPCTAVSDTDTGLAGVIGGGVDIRLTRRIDFRLAQVDYNPTRLNRRPLNIVALDPVKETQHNLRVGVGFVFH